MHRLLLPLGSVLFLCLFLGHVFASVLVRLAETGSAEMFPPWLINAARLFTAI
jgi:hypothetical protein